MSHVSPSRCRITCGLRILFLPLALFVGGMIARAGEPVVFVSRDFGEGGIGTPDPSRTTVARRARYGELLLLDSGGEVRSLVRPGAPSAPTDVMDPDVSYDAKRIVFSGFSPTERHWRIYEVGIDGEGLRQITRSDERIDLSPYGENASRLAGYDDLDPCYLPDGRICFVSTRYPGTAPDGRMRATNLFVVDSDGSNNHRITTERFGADTPVVNPTNGRIVYSRWWRTPDGGADSGDENGRIDENGDGQIGGGDGEPGIPPGSPGYGNAGGNNSGVGFAPEVLRTVEDEDFPGVNNWFLSGINPDGTGLAMFSGIKLDRELTQAYRPSFTRNGQALALFIPVSPLIGLPAQNGLRVYSPGAEAPDLLGGPQSFAAARNPLAVDPALFDNGLDELEEPELAKLLEEIFRAQFFGHVYASAVELPDRRLLVSAAKVVAGGFENGRLEPGALDYDLYTRGAEEVLVPLYSRPGTAELDAVVAVARPLPPVIEDAVGGRMENRAPQTVEEAYQRGGRFTFLVENIHANPPVDVELPGSPPVGKKLDIEFYMAPQGPATEGRDEPSLIERVRIPASGKVEVELPAGVPLFEVIRRPDDTIAVGRDGQIFHVGGMNFGRPGKEAGCVGCHAGHSMLEVPEDASWTNLASSAVVRTSSTRGAVFLPGFPDGRLPPDVDPAVNVGPDGVILPFPLGRDTAVNLVDRSTAAHVSEWVAAEAKADVSLQWSVPIRARELVLHGIRDVRNDAQRSLKIDGFRVETSLGGKAVSSVDFPQSLDTDASLRLRMDAGEAFDRLTISMAKVEGMVDGQQVPALSEIEVISRVAEDGVPPTISFRRGDANCNSSVDISDAVAILAHLYLGAGRLCCSAGADANDDSAVDMSDSVFILGFLFLGTAEPPAPGPRECGLGIEDKLLCDRQEICR